MPKIVHILILSSLFSTSMYAILDLNSTNEILEQATEATKELTAQLEPIVYEEIIQKEIEENNQTKEIDLNQTTIISEVIENKPIIEEKTVPIEENLSEPIAIEITPIELNTTEEITKVQTPAENNLTQEKKEKVEEKKIIEKEVVEKGDPRKGKNIFKYVLKEDCNMTAYKFAEKHTQEEWLEILEENKVKETIIQNCPNVKVYYQDKWTDDLYQFFYEASNEDEIPEC